MKKYEKYKDSGIDWINEIPECWEVKKIKHRCYVKARVGWKGLKSDEFLTTGYAYLVTGQDFKNDAVIWSECYHIDKERYEEDPYIQLKDNDLLITKDGTIGKLAIVRDLNKPACLNSGIFVVRSIKDDFTTDFLLWVLKSRSFLQFNEYTSYGSTIQHLYQNVFVEFSFPFPPIKEQTAIASYLDRKTSEIDELIADKKRLLELYEEEKTAIINELVTGKKVWDGNAWTEPAKVKDSGIEWLGEIPEHWEVKRLKFVGQIKYGLGQPPKQKLHGLPIIRATNVFRGQIDENNLVYVDPDDIPYDRDPILRTDDIIVVRSGAYTADSAIIPQKFDGAVTGYDMVFRCYKKYYPKFVAFGFLSDYILKRQLIMHSLRAAQPHLNREELGESIILVPPLQEQQSIVHHIETECNRINTQIERTKKLIDLLTEYRTALISEVVTGKIKVGEYY